MTSSPFDCNTPPELYKLGRKLPHFANALRNSDVIWQVGTNAAWKDYFLDDV